MVPPDESRLAVGTVGIVLVIGVLCMCAVLCSVSYYGLVENPCFGSVAVWEVLHEGIAALQTCQIESTSLSHTWCLELIFGVRVDRLED